MLKIYEARKNLLLLLLVMATTIAMAQEVRVSGKVTSADDGSPLPGVNIVEKGTSNGTITDADGNYGIAVKSGATLVFSFVGYTAQEVPVGGRTSVDVSLETDITALSEIVVVGYGQQEKKDVTGVVSAVSTKDFNKGAIVAPEQLIAGKVAGVSVTTTSGEPGAGINIRVRGGTSISAGNDPLFVIDGVPLDNNGSNATRNPLNFLNPSEIETFTVLKDASAAAIYGSRAANGVIIITTKKGKPGAPTLNYDGWYSVGSIANQLEVFSGEQYRELIAGKMPSALSNLGAANTDWQKQIYQTAIGRSHNLSFSGGTDNTNYRVSISDLDQSGIIKTSNTRRTGISFNIGSSFLNNSLRTNLSFKGAQTNDRFSPGVVGTALTFDPTQPVYDENSPYGGYFEWENDLGTKNPVAELNMIRDVARNNRGLGNFSVAYDLPFIKGLTANVNLGVDIANGSRKTFRPTNLRSEALDLANPKGRIYYQHPTRSSELLEVYGTYKKEFSSLESALEVTAGYSYQDWSSEYPEVTADTLSTNQFGFNNLAVAKSYVARNSIQENRLISFYGRLNYSLKNKYILTATLRRDGSSRFGPESRWGTFPSVAVAWRAIDEVFLSSLSNIFTDLKLRVGYGVTGNQEFANYQYLPTYTLGDNFTRYQFGNTLVNTIRPNGYDSELQWEQTAALNVGVDFGVLQGRLTGSLEYYNKQTSELLFNVTVPAGANLTNRIVTNIGELENKGVELSLDGLIVSKSDLRWNVGFNAALNNNRIITLDGNDDPEFIGFLTGNISGGVGNTIQILSVGSAVNTFYVYEHKMNGDKPLADGVDHNEDGVANDLDIYVDQDQSGSIDEGDLIKSKQPAPKMIFGLTSNLNYKGFDLSFTLRANTGNYVYNNNASNGAHYSRLSELVTQNILTSTLESNFTKAQYFSDYYIENASFVKMDNITLGYTLDNLISKSNIKARVYGTIQNAFVLTKYSGIDPEVSSGIDNNIYPRSRTFIVGVNVGF